MRRLWSRLDRYLSRQLQGAYALALSAFTVVFLLNFLFTLARQTIEKRVPFSLVIGFVLVEMPEILLTTMPMAAVVAILVVVGRLSVQHELVALRAAGISRARVFKPVLVLALVGAAGSGLLAHVVQPKGQQHRSALVREVIRARDLGREIDPGVFYQRLSDSVLYASRAVESPDGRVFEGIVLYREAPRGDLATLILSRRGQADFDRESGRIYLRLDDGERHVWNPTRPETPNVTRFPHYTISFPPDPAFRVSTEATRWDAQDFVGLELWDEIQRLTLESLQTSRPGLVAAAEKRLHKARVEWHRRMSLPVAILVLTWAAFPLAFRSQRGGRFAGLTQGILVIVAFSFLYVTGLGLANEEKASPWIGLWLANAVAFVWGSLLWSMRPPDEHRVSWLSQLLGKMFRPRSGVRRPARLEPGDPRRPASSPRVGTRPIVFARVDRYLGGAYLRMLGAVLVVLFAIVAGLEFRRAVAQLDESFTTFPWSEVMAFLAYSLPEQLAMILPISALAAAGISLSALARSGEITALKACGVGPARIAAPILVVTALFCGLYGFAQETIIPAASREAKTLLDHLRGRATAGMMDTGRRWIVGEDGRLWAYLDWDARRNAVLAPGVFRIDLDAGRLLERYEASEAVLEAGRWTFESGWRRFYSTDESGLFERFERTASEAREAPELFGANRDQLILGRALADQLPIRDLWAHVQRMSRAGYDASALRVSLLQKFVTPVISVALLLTGIPLVVSGWSRKGSLYGFGISLLVTFAFWAAWAVTTSLGREGVLSPPLAAFLPITVLTIVGLVLMVRSR